MGTQLKLELRIKPLEKTFGEKEKDGIEKALAEMISAYFGMIMEDGAPEGGKERRVGKS